MAARTLAAVPTGTVLLSTMTVYLFDRPADVARDREHVLQIGRAVFALRRADGDEHDFARAHGRGQIGGKGQTALPRWLRRTISSSPGS